MEPRKTTIEVFEVTPGEHIVQVTVHLDGAEVGQTQLPAGSLENAAAIAEGLRSLASRGMDLTGMMPDAVSTPDPPQIIGTETVYLGDERRLGGKGAKVLITGIFKANPNPTLFPDLDPGCRRHLVTDNALLARVGGVQPGDGAEAHVWLENEARWSFVGEEIEDVCQLRISTDVEICPENKTNKEE